MWRLSFTSTERRSEERKRACRCRRRAHGKRNRTKVELARNGPRRDVASAEAAEEARFLAGSLLDVNAQET